jgi:hypothetical protein
VRSRSAVLAAAVAVAAIGAGGASALAAPAHLAPGPAIATANPGATARSLSLSVSATGVPQAAAIGQSDSLWYYTKVKGKWKRKELAGAGSAFSAPSLVSGPGSDVAVAVEGPGHTLMVYVKTAGIWARLTAAGRNTTYAAPSLAVTSSHIAVAVEGKNHSLWLRWLGGSKWRAKEILGSGRVYSAPSLVVRSAIQASVSGGTGQADIAYEGPGNSLFYDYSTTSYYHWVNQVIGTAIAYSAPSLAVLDGSDATQGEAFIAVEGAQHSIWAYNNGAGTTFTAQELLSNGWVYAAPAVVQNNRDPNHAIEIAYRGSSTSLGVLLDLGGTSWQNDPLGHDGTVDSAPALYAAPNTGALSLIYQGKGNTLWYDRGPVPATDIAPTFSNGKIGGLHSAYGG